MKKVPPTLNSCSEKYMKKLANKKMIGSENPPNNTSIPASKTAYDIEQLKNNFINWFARMDSLLHVPK